MPADATELAGLVERYRSLGAGDRKAVRRNLAPSEFEALESACVEIDRARQAEQAPERQFRGYSPWLAALIEQALGDDRTQPDVTTACRAAIADAHRSMLDDGRGETIAARLVRLLGVAGAEAGPAGGL